MEESKKTPVTAEVMAWRLTAVESGLEKVLDKLESMDKTYVTHKDLEETKQQAKEEHIAIIKEIDETESMLEAKIAAVDKKVEDGNKTKWVNNALYSILGIVMTLLVSYFINGVVQ